MTHELENLQSDDIVLEALPDEVLASMESRDRWMANLEYAEGGLEFLVADLQSWTPGQVVRSRFSAVAELHAKIADATQRSSTRQPHSRLRPTATGNYRTWTTERHRVRAEIRVSFDRAGYFSLVGTDSIEPERRITQNAVGGRRTNGPSTSAASTCSAGRWRGTTRHEFLHALGSSTRTRTCAAPAKRSSGGRTTRATSPRRTPMAGSSPTATAADPGCTRMCPGPERVADAQVDHNLRTRELPGWPRAVRPRLGDALPVRAALLQVAAEPCAPRATGQPVGRRRRRWACSTRSTAEALEAIGERRQALLETIEGPGGEEGLESLAPALSELESHAAQSLRAGAFWSGCRRRVRAPRHVSGLARLVWHGSGELASSAADSPPEPRKLSRACLGPARTDACLDLPAARRPRSKELPSAYLRDSMWAGQGSNLRPWD